ncbi:MAG: DNA topoisomerase 3 [Oscillospiraceae bacterium]|nr:DNA topoisomerase 3 [Oscillospiraceae bacterium]
MGKRLVICEKPSVGNAYARCFGVASKKDGYIECGEYVITWCIGHLVELVNAEVYNENYRKWRIEDLPIIPDKWEYAVTANKNKQFEVVKKLMHDSKITEVINACDSGREGELIFRLVYEKAACTLPIKRLWISSMEEKAIIDGFNNLRDGTEYDSLYHSALCRSQADWLIGINATRLFTKLYNRKLNVGRVQTPTLAMLYERNEAITGFVKEKYHNVRLCFTVLENKELISVEGVSDKIKELPTAENIKAACDGQKAVVKSVKREKKTVNPPKLYDLSTLQREANRIYGFTAQQTLDYAQSLYEMRCITYPRSDSRYITEDMSEATANVIKIVLQTLPIQLNFKLNINRVIKNSGVSDHFAVLPTAALANADIDSLPDGERKVLLLIAGRLLCATAAVHEYEAVTAIVECNGFSFTTKGKTIINDGWKAIERLLKGGECDENDLDGDTPNIAEGQVFENPVCNIEEKWTSPPKHFTEDTLLSSMQRAGQRDAAPNSGYAGGDTHIEKCGLGTPATRAGIIEKLIKTGFVKREKKSLIPTDEGADLVSLMPDVLKSAKLTADWENGLSLIADGTLSPEKFMSEIIELTHTVITEGKANVNPDKVAKHENTGEIIGKCPRCGCDVCETPKAYSCSCGFTLWKSNKFFETARKPFTKSIAAALLKDGKIEMKGLYSPKKDKTYDAVVVLEDTGAYVNFKLEFPKGGK